MMLSSQLVVETSKKEDVSDSADAECPDCCSPLVVYYDGDDDNRVKYHCENCGQEVGAMDIGTSWDENSNVENYSNNNINTSHLE